MVAQDRRSLLPLWAWVALLVAGQAASLALIEAGNRVSYQHYRLTNTGPVTWVAVGVLVVQALLVALGMRGMWSALRGWMVNTIAPWARVAIGAAVVACAATVSKSPAFYVSETVVATLIQLVAIGNAIVIGRAVSPAPAMQRWARWFGRAGDTIDRSTRLDGFALACAAWVLVAAALLAIFSYQRHPHVPDEVIYILHARYLAEGVLTLPLPPAPLAFNVDLMHYTDTRWYSPLPPGWPAVLAIGAKFGVPWLVNPVLGAIDLLLAHVLLRSMYERRVARLATLLLATSPWFVFMSMNFMTHQATLFFGLLGALAVDRLRADRERGVAIRLSTCLALVGGGLAIGAASLVRPLEGLAIALLLGVWSLPPKWWTHLLTPARVVSLVPSLLLAVGAAASGALVRPYNRLITGDSRYFPIMAYTDKYYHKGSNDLGFGANRGLGWSGLDPFPGHGPIDVVVNANLNVTTTNVELLGWATGSLLVLFLLVGLRRLRRADWWHVAVLGLIAGIHSFYWFSGGPDFGARYWYLIIISCVALAARGIVEVGDSLARARDARESGEAGQARAISVAMVLLAAMLVTFMPWRAVDKYYHYRNMRPDIRALASDGAFGTRSLVLVRGRRHPDFASAMASNPLDLEADVPVFAWDVSPEARAQALEAYSDREVYFVDGPTRTGDGFRVVSGPLTVAQARTFEAP